MGRRAWLAIAIVVGTGLRGAYADSCVAPSFGPSVPHPFDALPHGIAVGDFNRDGHADLAVGRYWEVQVAILLGNGSGGFTPGEIINFEVYGTLESVVAADFDRDGKLDLAIAEAAAQSVAVVRGTGNGTFLPPTYHAVGVLPRRLAVADLNRDGRADLVAAGQDGAYVLLGDAAGGFAPAVTHPAGQYLRFVATADFNRDGKVDVLTTSSFVPLPGAPPDRVFVLLGDGNGGLGAPTPYEVGADEWEVAIGDLDRDGDLDLAVVHTTGLRILPGRGDGTFGAPADVHIGPTGHSVQVADVDGSGTLDLVLSGHFETRVRLGNGNGTFAAPTTFPMGAYDGFLAVADLNGDDRPDLLVEGEQTLDTRLNSFGTPCPRAAFEPIFQTTLVGGVPTGVTVGEINRDGRPDVVVTSASPPQVTLLRGDGNGSFFLAVPPLAGGPRPNDAAIADFNRDGFPDVAVSSEGTSDIMLLLGAPGPSFQVNLRFAGGVMQGVVAADFNRDGRPDLAVTDLLQNELRVLLGDGESGFAAPQALPVLAPRRAYVADLNRDGRVDLAVTGDAGAVTVLFGDGGGGFPTRAVLSVPGRPGSIAVADLNGDGREDLAAQVNDGPVLVFFGDGSGAFPTSLTLPAGPSAQAVVALDFDADGREDLAVAQGTGTSPMALVRNLGGGAFGTAQLVGTSGTALGVVAGFFDGDGRIDLALLDLPEQRLITYRNVRCTPAALAMAVDLAACNAPGVPFAPQPVVEVQDLGGNPALCAQGTVTARLLPSSPPGATLGGTLSAPVQQGLATFTNLSVDLAARGFQLGFDLGTLTTSSRVFDQLLMVDIEGPSRICPGGSGTFTAVQEYDSYAWTLDGSPISSTRTAAVNGLTAGPHSLRLAVSQGTCQAEDLHPLLGAGPPAVVSGDAAMCAVSAALVRADLEGAPPWSLTWSDGFTQTGVTTSPVLRTVRPADTTTYTLSSFADGQCAGSSSGSATITVDQACTARYFPVLPCRLLDTRNAPGPSGGPALGANSSRAFPVTGLCGIPATAKAVAVNLTAVNPGELGNLRLFPTGTPLPPASSLNFAAAVTRANNAIVALGAGGQLTVQCDMAAGSTAGTHLVMDVFGFFE